MKLKITSSEVDGTSVVVLDGRIVIGEESQSLREKVKSLVAEGKKNIILNMSHVEYIDSRATSSISIAQGLGYWPRACECKNPGRNAQARQPGQEI
jgi:anti-anti-sigma regulatory factor